MNLIVTLARALLCWCRLHHWAARRGFAGLEVCEWCAHFRLAALRADGFDVVETPR